jgi:hypothetical protein
MIHPGSTYKLSKLLFSDSFLSHLIVHLNILIGILVAKQLDNLVDDLGQVPYLTRKEAVNYHRIIPTILTPVIIPELTEQPR